MSKQLSEQEVKQILGIDSFKEMTKDKVMSFASMLSDMDPAVAQEAIEQFPNFANMTLEALRDYKTVLDKSLDKNDSSTQNCYDIWKVMTDTLSRCVQDEDITLEERKYYIEKMGEVADKASVKDTENKKFIRDIVFIGAAALCTGLGVGLAALTGGKFDFHFPSQKA